jgi:hypothetical protein
MTFKVEKNNHLFFIKIFVTTKEKIDNIHNQKNNNKVENFTFFPS